MLAFEINVNKEYIGKCGFEDWVVLNAILTALKPKDAPDEENISFSVGGLAEVNSENTGQHVRLIQRDLQIGDIVEIKVVETDHVIDPIKRYRSDSQIQENPFTEEEILQMEREDYVRLKAKFEK